MVTLSDVFHIWIGIAWQLEELFSIDTEAFQQRESILKIYNSRFKKQLENITHCGSKGKDILILAYWLDKGLSVPSFRTDHTLKLPSARQEGAMRLQLPSDQAAFDKLGPSSWPTLLKRLVVSATCVLNAEQDRSGRIDRLAVQRLAKQLVAYAYNRSPFSIACEPGIRSAVWWTAMEKDSNCAELAVSSDSCWRECTAHRCSMLRR